MNFQPKLTIRDLLWLVIVVALAGAWISDRLRLECALKDANRQGVADSDEIFRLKRTINDVLTKRLSPEFLQKLEESTSKYRLP